MRETMAMGVWKGIPPPLKLRGIRRSLGGGGKDPQNAGIDDRPCGTGPQEPREAAEERQNDNTVNKVPPGKCVAHLHKPPPPGRCVRPIVRVTGNGGKAALAFSPGLVAGQRRR